MRINGKEFTLIEALIVVGIIGVLFFALIWPTFYRPLGWCHQPHPGKCHLEDALERIDKLERKLK